MADVTTMVVTVNLKCEKNKKKVKKVLCKIPEIENQEYDEKKNTVTITVVSCCPEKIKKKIFCKGGCMIQGIEVPPVKKPEAKPKPDKKDEKPAKPVCPPKECCKECSGVCPPRDCCKEWGTCYKPLPPPCNYPYYGCYGRPVCDCWGSGCRRCYLICEENLTPCTIM